MNIQQYEDIVKNDASLLLDLYINGKLNSIDTVAEIKKLLKSKIDNLDTSKLSIGFTHRKIENNTRIMFTSTYNGTNLPAIYIDFEHIKKDVDAVDKYTLLLERLKKNLNNENISITIDCSSITVDDYAKHECIVQVGWYYGAFWVAQGFNNEAKLTEQDLLDFNILSLERI